jgi:hypothetical protein
MMTSKGLKLTFSSRILKGVSYEEVFYNVIDEVVIFIAIDDEAAR